MSVKEYFHFNTLNKQTATVKKSDNGGRCH